MPAPYPTLLTATRGIALKPEHRTALGHWRQFAVALTLGGAIAVAAVLMFPDTAGLAILGAYCIPTNSVIPLPHEPGVLFFADFYRPLWIAVAATVGSGIAAFSDYAIVRGAMRHKWASRVSRGRWFQWAVRSFMKRPFATVVLFAVSPLPVSVVRVLAPASTFSVWRYVAAMMVGRFPRFYVFAWVGLLLPIPTWVLVLAVLAPVLTMVIAHRSGSDEGGGEEERAIEAAIASSGGSLAAFESDTGASAAGPLDSQSCDASG